jgi:hypothetical protein
LPLAEYWELRQPWKRNGMIQSFEAIYEPEASARAERAFYVRSVWELRRFMTLAPPIAFLIFVTSGLALGAPAWFVAFFAVFLGLSVLGPIFFYIARPLAAKRAALKCPTRRITLTPETIQISAGERSSDIPWARVKHVWDAGDYVLLVFGRFASFGLPKDCLPEGASEFIRACVQQTST